MASYSSEVSEIVVTRPDGSSVRILHMAALTDGQRLREEIVVPLSEYAALPIANLMPQAVEVRSREQADAWLVQGAALMFVGGLVYALSLEALASRSIEEPTTERAVFGPKDTLIESIDKNIGMIRGHLRDPRLRMERLIIGTRVPSTIGVCYVDGVVDAQELDDVMDRLTRWRPARVGFVSALLRPLFGPIWGPFLPADFSERPYRVADLLYRGRIAILVDGSPYALLIPMPFLDLFVDEEEYLQATTTRYFVRALRFLAFAIALFGPGLYVAVMTVNTTVLPGLLAVAVASNRQSLAFPIISETVLMLVVLDIMVEATTAMKGVLGPAISIVGSLIVGQAAVRANLASNLGVIVLALTALATFITPRFQITYAVRVWKYPFLIVGGIFGLVGWSVTLLWLLTTVSSQRSVGVPYLAPVAPVLPAAWQTESPSQHGWQGSTTQFVRRRPWRRR